MRGCWLLLIAALGSPALADTGETKVAAGSTVALHDLTFKVPDTFEWVTYESKQYPALAARAPGAPVNGAYAIFVSPVFTGATSCKGWSAPLDNARPVSRPGWPRAAALVGASEDDGHEWTSACFDTKAGALGITVKTDHHAGANVDDVAAQLVTSIVAAAANVPRATFVHAEHAKGSNVLIPTLQFAITVPRTSWTLLDDVARGKAIWFAGDEAHPDMSIALDIDPDARSCDDWLVVQTSARTYVERPAFWPRGGATRGVVPINEDLQKPGGWNGCLATKRGPILARVVPSNAVKAARLADARALLEAVIAGAKAGSGPLPGAGSYDGASPDASGQITLPVTKHTVHVASGAEWFAPRIKEFDILEMHGDGPTVEIAILPRKEPCEPQLDGTARASWPDGVRPLVRRAASGVETADVCVGSKEPYDIAVISLALAGTDAARVRFVVEQLLKGAQ